LDNTRTTAVHRLWAWTGLRNGIISEHLVLSSPCAALSVKANVCALGMSWDYALGLRLRSNLDYMGATAVHCLWAWTGLWNGIVSEHLVLSSPCAALSVKANVCALGMSWDYAPGLRLWSNLDYAGATAVHCLWAWTGLRNGIVSEHLVLSSPCATLSVKVNVCALGMSWDYAPGLSFWS